MPELPPPACEPISHTSMAPRLLAILGILVIIWQFPSFLERIEYARVHGRERAESDVAREELKDAKITDLSRMSGLIAKLVGPSVVHIDTVRVVNGRRGRDEWSQLFGGRAQFFQSEGQGSGVIVDPAGYIVTNNHVVERAAKIEVQLSDGRKKIAEVIGSDPLTDIAVVKIDADNLVAAQWGDSDKLEVGALVWAIGNPFGLDRSVTFGIISAKGRPGANPFQNYLQTDAAVNPGNSGGPLVNIEGKVVGINTAIVGPAYQGVSFSIPSNEAHKVYERIKEDGKVARGWLGVAPDPLTLELAKQLKLTELRGALVKEVDPDGPAKKAGIQIGDVIIEWNGQSIDTPAILSPIVAATKIGSTAKAVIMRDGKRMEIDVQVEERPGQFNR
jgi:serine protease Do